MNRPTKAIIAAAGFGTRFLPQTKAMPKEMLPLIDKPIIQYVVEELVQAGIKDIIIVGSSNKRAIEDHFDTPNEDLIANLKAGGKKKEPLLEEVKHISELANFIYVRQKGPYGLATPILSAAHLIGDEPFVFTLADDFFVSSPGRTTQMIDTYLSLGGSGIFACKEVTEDAEFDRYGIVAGDNVDQSTIKLTGIVEKPGVDSAPSKLASVSGYLFTPEIFPYIERSKDTLQDGELMLQPIVQNMIDDGHNFYARKINDATYYDTGDKLEYLKTTVDFGLKHGDLGPAFRSYLENRLKR